MNYADRFLSQLQRSVPGMFYWVAFPGVVMFHLNVNNCSVLLPFAPAESPFVPPPVPPNRAPPPSSDLNKSISSVFELSLRIISYGSPPSGQELLEVGEEALLECVEDLQADLLVLLFEAVDLGLQSVVLLFHRSQLHAGGQNST